MMVALLVLAIVGQAYLLGSIPFGLLIARAGGVDIRNEGSKNIGATNVWRVMGRKYGLTTFIMDVAKGWLAVIVGMWMAEAFPVGRELAPSAGDVRAYAGIAASLGCILGHSFPVWLNFKGGKGVATSMGVLLGVMPVASLTIFAIWGLVFKVTRYVSLASVIAALSLPIVVIVLLFMGWLHGWALFYFATAATMLVVRRHTENIRRLVAGTENRFGTPKPDQESPE